MAKCTGVSLEAYRELEAGNADFTFTFIYKCAARFGVDTTDLLKGESPTLEEYSITRAGGGLPIARRKGFQYRNMAPLFKGKIAEPFVVTARYSEEEQNKPIKLSKHEGHEYNYILSGSLKTSIDGHEEILGPGDSIYYDSSKPHGMIAHGGDCQFLAIVISNGGAAYDYPDEEAEASTAPTAENTLSPLPEDPVALRFIECTEENGKLKKIEFKNADRYNFAYDTVDAIAQKTPDKLALLHLDVNKNERRFTYRDISLLSNRAANYFESLGIKHGDTVMLVLKRHWQFWIASIALHKLGAVAIPATHMLVEHDFEYRYKAASVAAVVCTADGDTAMHAENAEKLVEQDIVKIIANGHRDGWHSFDDEFMAFPETFERRMNACGNETMYMLFTSGTTGYPKIAAHSFKYALGHYITARYWHNADPNGIHFTISDTGWGKALWGKLYGQWLCESCVFAYDFDKFDADDLLPLFAKYQITTFCAPPTMFRFFIKAGIENYDLSSLKHCTIAGEALNPEVFNKFKEYTGLSLMEGFGQTETTLVIANLVGDTPKPGSMGRPSPLYDVDIVDYDGRSCDVGETGEIVIRTTEAVPAGLFKGYYRNEEATKEAWHDGYYHTGDTAWRDEDGYIWYVGRVDDVIKSSGYRIGPFEIESVIMELPYVLECAITAVPDEIRGQVVKASIVLVPGKEGSPDLVREIQTYVKEHTAPYKYPRIVEFLPELPKTISGKIRRVELRAKDAKK
ncbi:MAG: cupin domain-containing protein [Ruminococcaceae bacterium]|nr:cupin domain-containing protein [Oscillospiraceae bacterium]